MDFLYFTWSNIQHESGSVLSASQQDGFKVALLPFRFAPFYGKSATLKPPFIAALCEIIERR